MADFENRKVVLFTGEFIESEDVLCFQDASEDFPALKIGKEYFIFNKKHGALTRVSSAIGRFNYIKDVPEPLYCFWNKRTKKDRRGYGAVLFRGEWFLVVRHENFPAHANRYNNYCHHINSCRISRLIELARKPEFEGCRFLLSTMTDAPFKQSKEAKLWCLIPADRIYDENLLNAAQKMLDQNPCTRKPEDCEIFNKYNYRGAGKRT